MFSRRKEKCPVHGCELREEKNPSESAKEFGVKSLQSEVKHGRGDFNLWVEEAISVCPLCAETERKAAENESQRVEAENRKREAREAAYFCQGCGRRLDSRSHNFCPDCGVSHSCECGRAWQKGESFCPSCGTER